MISHTTNDEFELLYDQYREEALCLALRLSGDRALAEDAVQESMLRIWRADLQARTVHSRSWVMRIVANECARLRTARQRESKRIQRSALMAAPAQEQNVGRQVFALLKNALQKLPAIESNLLKLRYESGFSQRRISAVVAIPQQTVSYRLRCAIRGIRRAMSGVNEA